MRKLGLVILGATLIGTPAGANPMTDRVLRVQQVPQTHHVQVSYGVDTSVATFENPTSLHRDSTALSPTWTTTTGFTANTGSGLATLSAAQWCDCNVPTGAHTYAVAVTGSGTLQAELTVVASLAYPADAGVVSPDADPWDIPEPVDLQGLDCNTACGGTGTPDAGVVDAGSGTPDAGTDPPKDDGGCSLVGGSVGIPLVGLWAGLSLLMLVVITFRRRRK